MSPAPPTAVRPDGDPAAAEPTVAPEPPVAPEPTVVPEPAVAPEPPVVPEPWLAAEPPAEEAGPALDPPADPPDDELDPDDPPTECTGAAMETVGVGTDGTVTLGTVIDGVVTLGTVTVTDGIVTDTTGTDTDGTVILGVRGDALLVATAANMPSAATAARSMPLRRPERERPGTARWSSLFPGFHLHLPCIARRLLRVLRALSSVQFQAGDPNAAWSARRT